TILVLISLLIINVGLRLFIRPYVGAVDLLPAPIRRAHLVLLDVAVLVLFCGCLYLTIRVASDRDIEFVPVTIVWCYLLLAVRATVYGRTSTVGSVQSVGKV